MYTSQVQSSGNNVKEGRVKRNGGGMFIVLIWWRYYSVDVDGWFDSFTRTPVYTMGAMYDFRMKMRLLMVECWMTISKYSTVYLLTNIGRVVKDDYKEEEKGDK